MRLMDSSEVCDLLGISKSTLFRWCGVSENSDDDSNTLHHYSSIATQLMIKSASFYSSASDETPYDFPRPFKIGRAYKWKDTEVMDWLETRRV